MYEPETRKQFAVRLIEEMIDDYIRNIKIQKSSKAKTERQIATKENAELKQYLLMKDVERPLLDIIELCFGIGVNRLTGQLLKFLERIDQETNTIEHTKNSSHKVARSEQNSFFED